jgi:hypothetical protein
VYVGWATVEDGQGGALPPAARVAHKAVLSIGWNPTFHNEKRTVEAYLCHDFERDFYGADMRLIVCGYVRPQACHGRTRTSLSHASCAPHSDSPVASQEDFFTEGVAYEAAMATLIEAIAADVEFGKSQLETPEMLAFRSDPFLAVPVAS